jgi:hypothetical protein
MLRAVKDKNCQPRGGSGTRTAKKAGSVSDNTSVRMREGEYEGD